MKLEGRTVLLTGASGGIGREAARQIARAGARLALFARGEDKLQKEAASRKLDPWQIAREVEGWFHEDRRTLRILDAHRYPRATEHIAEMIAMIKDLVGNGHAYVADGNVYFSVGSFPRWVIQSKSDTPPGWTPSRFRRARC